VWPQPVKATALSNAFDGVIHSSDCRGRVLRDRAMASSTTWQRDFDLSYGKLSS
jgi:hypothetical protein